MYEALIRQLGSVTLARPDGSVTNLRLFGSKCDKSLADIRGFVKQMLLITGESLGFFPGYRLSVNCSPDPLNRETFDTSPNFPPTMSQKSGQIVSLGARCIGL